MTPIVFGCLVWFPREALACATCFGAAEAPQTKAMNMAILSLLGVIGTVLGLFAAFFIYLAFRAKSMTSETVEVEQTGPPGPGQLAEVNANE